MKWAAVTIALTACFGFLTASSHAQEETVRILFLSKSSGFEHSCIRQSNGKPSHVDKVLEALAEENNVEITITKDASIVNAEDLKNFQLVIFFTTGDLTSPGADGNPPMGEKGVEELVDWIKAGGGFMGFHCASDTFHTPKDSPATPYIEMIGGEFRAHGAQFEGTVTVVDPSHPAVAIMPNKWPIKDEWYLFRNLNEDKIHVLALLDPGSERTKQEKYNIPNYPIIWCSELGEGRVFFNAMGHREDVWDNKTFQQSVIDAATWAMGEGPAQAEPNYKDVVPKK